MPLFKKRPVYCYAISNGAFFDFESIYSACISLKGEYTNAMCSTIIQSIKTPVDRKYSAIGYVWFDKIEGESPVQANEIYCALNYRYSVMNHPGNVNWETLNKAHSARKSPVIAYKDGEELYYDSVNEAAEDFGTPVSNICRVLNRQNKGDSNHHLDKKQLTAAGWHFRYAR